MSGVSVIYLLASWYNGNLSQSSATATVQVQVKLVFTFTNLTSQYFCFKVSRYLSSVRRCEQSVKMFCETYMLAVLADARSLVAAQA